MQQEEGETEPRQQEQPTAPLKCPRCDSLDTKFRYYNNNDRAQPRHYCKTCRRYWTVGGSIRNIPFGGSSRNGKQIKESSSRYSNSITPLLPPPSTSEEEWQHRSQYPTPMAVVEPQTFDTTIIEPLGNLSAPISSPSSYHFNDEISCLAAIQSLIQPQEINESDYTGNQFSNGSVDMKFLQEGNFQSMPLQPQQIPNLSESSQKNIQDHEVNARYLSDDSLVHPIWPMNSLPQDFNNNFNFSTSNASFQNNSTGNTTDPETARTSEGPNQWPNFPNYGPS